MAGVVLLPLRAQVLATPLSPIEAHRGPAPAAELHLSESAAARIALGDQEGDTEKPKAMKTSSDEATEAAARQNQTRKQATPDSTWDFLKDWPFWVIVGGVAVVAVGSIIIYKNTRPDDSCPALDTAGCYGGK